MCLFPSPSTLFPLPLLALLRPRTNPFVAVVMAALQSWLPSDTEFRVTEASSQTVAQNRICWWFVSIVFAAQVIEFSAAISSNHNTVCPTLKRKRSETNLWPCDNTWHLCHPLDTHFLMATILCTFPWASCYWERDWCSCHGRSNTGRPSCVRTPAFLWCRGSCGASSKPPNRWFSFVHAICYEYSHFQP